MDIAVIIPTYNRQHTLGRALDSVLQQTHPASEIVVVDDGSTDQTVEYLTKHYSQVRYIECVANRGVSSARNAGIQSVTAEWIALLDSDDEWRPEKLMCQVESLNARPAYRICHTDEVWIRNGRRVNPMLKHAKQGGEIFLNCLPRCVVSPSSVLIHRSVFEDVGMFDEALPACEDYDLWLRICAKYDVLFLNEKLLIKYGGHEDQLSRQHWGMDRFRVHALEKIIGVSSLTEYYRTEVLKMLVEKLLILIKGAKKRKNVEFEQACTEKLKCYRNMLEAIMKSNNMQMDRQSQ